MDKRILERCEDEALHLSGAIQPHGALLALDADGRVSHASANTAALLDAAPEAWLDKPLPDSIDALTATTGDKPGSRSVVYDAIDTSAGLLDVGVTRGAQGALTLEFIPAAPRQRLKNCRACATTALEFVPAAPPECCLATTSEHTHPERRVPDSPAALLAQRQTLVDEIAALTGFERVMFYAFMDGGDGEVLAEACSGDTYGSYLGLRFPASDIPHVARALYLKNPWRLIPDAAAEAVPLIGRGAAPDLTWSDLRSVSPVHRIYLANMGVAASLSFPVVSGGELVALVSAHHSRPTRLPLCVMEIGAAQVRAHAFAYASYCSQQRMRMIDGLVYRFNAMQAILHRHGGLVAAWPELGAWLCQEFKVDGATFCHDETALAVGVGFEPAALNALDDWFAGSIRDFVWAGDNLSRQVPGYPLSELAGAVAIRIGQPGSAVARIYLGRREHIHEVAWGGNPDKPVEYHDGEVGIAPRRSFEKWVERRLGHCRPWSNETRLLALKLRELLLASLHD